MINEIKNIIKNITGKLLTFGVVEHELIDEIVKNEKIDDFLILSFTKKIEYSDKVNCTPVKKVKVNKLKRKNKKNKFDYVIFEVSDTKENINKLIYDSLKLASKKIIFYGNSKDYKSSSIVKKYKRYGLKIKLQKYEEKNYVIEIEMKKINIFTKIYYKITDFFVNIYDSISQALTS